MRIAFFLNHKLSGKGGSELMTRRLIDELELNHKVTKVSLSDDPLTLNIGKDLDKILINYKLYDINSDPEEYFLECMEYNEELKSKYPKGGESIFHINLGIKSSIIQNYFTLNKVDLIITPSLYDSMLLTYNGKLDTPIITMTHGRPDYDYTDFPWTRKTYEKLELSRTYDKVDKIQVLLPNYEEFLPFDVRYKSIAIPNYIVEPKYKKFSTSKLIVNVGRLDCSNKSQDLLIDVFNEFNDGSWKLELYGEGPDKKYLREKVGSNPSIKLMDHSDDILDVFFRSQLHISMSKYEGLPLSLLESMSVGVPTIGSYYCSGVNEILPDEFLYRDTDSLLGLMNMYKDSPSIYYNLDSYTYEIWSSKWNNLINEFK